MPFRLVKRNKPSTLDEAGLKAQWPRIWIMICGILLIFLNFSMAGMEIGNTVIDYYRATAFGGFILFPFLLAGGVLVVVVAFKPRLILLRGAMISCIIMIILCLVLIACDIVIVVDPTRCLFLNCNYAQVNASNLTNINIVYGWPVYITWPNYFQTNMNAKRIFQSIQMLCAFLFIMLAALFILTYYIYLILNSHKKKDIDNGGQPALVTAETVVPPVKYSNDTVSSDAQNGHRHLITTYMIGGRSSASTKYHSSSESIVVHTITPELAEVYRITPEPAEVHRITPKPAQVHRITPEPAEVHRITPKRGPAEVHTETPRKIKKKIYVQPRASSVSYDRICTRCLKEPRMVLTTNFDRQNYFSHLCANCNKEIASYHHKPSTTQQTDNRGWRT